MAPFNYLFMTPLTDSRLAVGIFFIISGFVLSYRFIGYRMEPATFVKTLVARYIRLTIPIAVVSLLVLVFGFYSSFLHNIKATALEPKWGYDPFYTFNPSFTDALKFSFWNVFLNYDNNHTYIPPAWTMPRELLGSYFIYTTVFIAGFHNYWNRRRLFITMIAVSAFLVLNLRFHYTAFFLYGYLLAEYYKSNTTSNQTSPNNRVAFLAFIALMIFSSFRSPDRSVFLPLVGMSLIVVWSVLYSQRLSAFFSNRVSLFLGKISFPLYLIHVPIYCTFSSWLISWLYGLGFNQLQTYSMVYLTSLPLVIISAYFLYPMERFAIDVSRRISRFSLKAFFNNLSLDTKTGVEI
ncbi:acyltransferase family protein [Legionella lansingensis]